MKWKPSVNTDIEPINLPPIPKAVSGLKKDGRPDKRFKRGDTMVELEQSMKQIVGKPTKSIFK